MASDGYKLTVGAHAGPRQILSPALTPQMQQSLKMLQMTAVDLAAELRVQLEQNPVIEDVRNPSETLLSVAAPEEHADKSAADRDMELDFTPDGAAAENILGADDGQLDYFLGNMESASGDEDAPSRRQRLFDAQHSSETLQEHLLAQVPYGDFAREGDAALAEMLIAHVADSGQFTGSYPDIIMATGATEKRLEAIRRRILMFDPAGCGWRDPRECLLAQLEKLDDSPWQGEVRKIIARHLEDVAFNREDKICAALNLTRDELAQALAALKTLSPNPGCDRRFIAACDRPQYVHPEVRAVLLDGRWTAVVDARELPVIRISPRYRALLNDPAASEETKAYVREHLRAAQTLVSSLDQRQETIRQIAQAVIDAQPGFFSKGLSARVPMTMQDIADRVGVHVTTVSRTVRNKYMATPFGTVELRQFFTSGFVSATGEEICQSAVLERLKALVDAEDKHKPLSDQRLSELLGEKGLAVARRTVAKYRGTLKIPGAAARRLG